MRGGGDVHRLGRHFHRQTTFEHVTQERLRDELKEGLRRSTYFLYASLDFSISLKAPKTFQIDSQLIWTSTKNQYNNGVKCKV